jgi:hypothetical protein
MVYNKRVKSLKGRIKGVEGWEGEELEGEKKRGGGGGGGLGTGTGALLIITHLFLSPRGLL